jgi:hypothetical protein
MLFASTMPTHAEKNRGRRVLFPLKRANISPFGLYDRAAGPSSLPCSLLSLSLLALALRLQVRREPPLARHWRLFPLPLLLRCERFALKSSRRCHDPREIACHAGGFFAW